MSDSVRPHRRQPTRLPRPWDSPGKNTGVGCHFLLQRMKMKSESESVIPSSHLILCRPLLLLPPILPSIGVFSNESALSIRWPKHWSFSFIISLSNEYSRSISFAVQGTLESLLQHHSSKASILQCSAFIIRKQLPIVASAFHFLFR